MVMPLAAREYLQATRYESRAQVSLTPGSFSVDVTYSVRPEFAYRNTQVAVVISLGNSSGASLPTTHSIELLPGKTDFKEGFRVIFGAAAQAGDFINYHLLLVDQTP